jgi:hypothetical protein
MLLSDGSMIKNDVIKSFKVAVANPENQHVGGGINWNFVDADLNLDLGGLYSSEYLLECFEVLVDEYFS